MSEKIDVTKGLNMKVVGIDAEAAHFILESFGQMKDSALEKALNVTGRDEKGNPNPFEVTFQVNGIDVPFANTIHSLYAMLETLVTNKAEDLLKAKSLDAINELESVLNNSRWSIEEAIKNLVEEVTIKNLIVERRQ